MTDTKGSTLWDKAIKDAMNQIVRLRTAIAIFEEMKASGKPWPSKDHVERRLRETAKAQT